jgi:hypothetical protein
MPGEFVMEKVRWLRDNPKSRKVLYWGSVLIVLVLIVIGSVTLVTDSASSAGWGELIGGLLLAAVVHFLRVGYQASVPLLPPVAAPQN